MFRWSGIWTRLRQRRPSPVVASAWSKRRPVDHAVGSTYRQVIETLQESEVAEFVVKGMRH